MLNEIEEHIKYFLNAINKIKENADGINPANLRYPIYFILLDVLAKYAFPTEEAGGERFINLIDSYSNWEYRNYVSILLLNDLLKIEKEKKCFKENKEYEVLKEKVNEARNKWGQVREHRIYNPKEADLTIEDFKPFEGNRYWKLIKKCRYSSCIYQMRNGFIHDFAFPGLPNLFHDVDKQTPYYCTCENSYRLCIPAEIISILVEKCSSNLKEKIMQETDKHDPYKIFKDMPDWFPKLMKKKKCF